MPPYTDQFARVKFKYESSPKCTQQTNFENLILSQAAPPKTNPPKWERGVGADGVLKVDTCMHGAPIVGQRHRREWSGAQVHSKNMAQQSHCLTARAPN